MSILCKNIVATQIINCTQENTFHAGTTNPKIKSQTKSKHQQAPHQVL